MQSNWKEPADGGNATAYRVQRREGDAEAWVDVGRQPWDWKSLYRDNWVGRNWSFALWL
uniref:Uncharacterized protein n=1 Tax=Candidatus Kentrum sp. UNK TaxID=2126344 RepID=A0A451B5K9_9GAMM|nr:MAG: hypothetical protein BECKUNK1418G_GA0071005_12302 [Candidatus Kentron sp. UNK]VFK73573.1 MAG: hypothetical protein BECKUNK1418H_GA0071006_12222 [Candidatus Kentron sp. UNK]